MLKVCDRGCGLQNNNIRCQNRGGFDLLLIAILLLLSCGGGTSGPQGDKTPPTILAVAPADNAVDIAIDTTIKVTFSEPIDPASVTPTSFSLNNGVTGAFSFDGNTVTLTPSADLEYNTVYNGTLTTALTDTAGNHLGAAFECSFTTVVDPNLQPAVVLSRTPTSGAYNVEINTTVMATFSKGMNPATITTSSFTISGGVTGAVSYAGNTATFTPEADLAYDTPYTVTLTTAVADTFGVPLAQNVVWQFRTRPDPSIPLVAILSPEELNIVGSPMEVVVEATHPDGIDKVELYFNGTLVDSALNPSQQTIFNRDISLWLVGSTHEISAKAYSGAHEGVSISTEVIYLWEELDNDINNAWSTDIKNVSYRSTFETLELRFEFWENWTFPYPYDSLNDTTYFDPSFDLAIFFDVDRNNLTGRQTVGIGQLNDIGADYRLILGLHGGDTALAFPDAITTAWHKLYDTTGLAYHFVPRDTNVLEIGINWSDFSYVSAVYIVSACANQELGSMPADIRTDWLPDQGQGHITVYRDGRYVGPPHPAMGKSAGFSHPFRPAPDPPNPFE